MKKFKYEFEVDDDFEVGVCYDCPLYEWVDCNNSMRLHCVIGYPYVYCPLVEVK